MSSCVFCGEPFSEERPRSDEHAAPNWARKLLPDRGRAEHLAMFETSEGMRVEHRGLKNPFTSVAQDVCEPCNTGWMHELEAASEPLLTHFILGHERRIRYWRQVLTATWAVKTALVWDVVSPDDRAVPFQDFRILHRAQRPTGTNQVWIGRYSGDDPHSFRRTAAHVIGATDAEPGRAHAYMVAITVGQLALTVLGQWVIQPPYSFPLPDDLESRLVQIWPAADEIVSWPPSAALDDAALEAIVRSLGTPIPGSEAE